VKKLLLLLTLCLTVLAVAYFGQSATAQDQSEGSTAGQMKEGEPPVKETGCLCVRYQDLVVGTGAECKLGSKVKVHYTLWFADSTGQKQKRFQSSKDGEGTPFTCTLGQGLIYGWSHGMVGMKEGGTRRLIIPPMLGYGAGGRGIPPNQWLVFEIDFLELLG
jgi:FKBP-type peptidyl-prolyl cis-trans isomerase FkpA